MPVVVYSKLVGDYDSLSRMTLKELDYYEKKLAEIADHSRIPQPETERRLQHIREEREWRAANPARQARP
jgi:hypothetical protein